MFQRSSPQAIRRCTLGLLLGCFGCADPSSTSSGTSPVALEEESDVDEAAAPSLDTGGQPAELPAPEDTLSAQDSEGHQSRGEGEGDALDATDAEATWGADVALPSPPSDTLESASFPDDGSAPTDIATSVDDALEEGPDTGAEPALTCAEELITLTPANNEHFEFYELCVSEGLSDEAALKLVDPTLYCGVAGFFAGCKAEGELGCHGDLEFAPPSGPSLSDGCWSTLCALSEMPGVRVIAGGHWL